jgi:4-amino-4-deoxy-L-arabinose transferase-like glycosyltransferase
MFDLRSYETQSERVHPWMMYDTWAYMSQADFIYKGKPEKIPSQPNGLPCLIAAFKTFVPETALPVLLIALNVIMSTAVIPMTYAICRRWTGNVNLSLWAAFLLAIWPNQLIHMRAIQTEPPTLFFLVLSVYLLTLHKPFTSGIAYGCAAVVRSVFLSLGVFMLFLPLFNRRAWKKSGLFLAGLAIPAVVVSSISHYRTGVGLSGSTAYNIAYSLDHWGMYDFRVYGENWRPGYFPHSRVCDISTADALQLYVKEHYDYPAFYFSQRFMSFWELWGPWPCPMGTNWMTKILGIRFPAFILALWGIYAMRKKLAEESVYLGAVTLLMFTVQHTIWHSQFRFTYPVEPILLIFAIIGAASIFARWEKKPLEFIEKTYDDHAE